MNPANEPEGPEGTPRTTPHRSFLDDDVADGHEHGERTRGEEPSGEVAPRAHTEGGSD